MDNPTAWWILAGFFVAMELVSGTFYLLMLAVGAVAGALAAHAGLTMPWHWIAFTVVGGGAVVALYLSRRLFGKRTAEDVRHDNLDLGATVDVTTWSADGVARVHYRGSDWSARPVRRGPLHTGPHRIAGQDGNVLLIEPLPAALNPAPADTKVQHNPG
ncbi:MAG: NfeD family protein [Thiomonas sp.]|nr:NfeD family protein [Thiomonas sp.]